MDKELSRKGASGLKLDRELAGDPRGVKLREISARLHEGRARASQSMTRQSVVRIRAYEAAILLLPELWRLKQRRN